MLSVFVGKYRSIKDSKKDEKRLRAAGLSPYLFSASDGFTFKVASSSRESELDVLVRRLNAEGFLAFKGE